MNHRLQKSILLLSGAALGINYTQAQPQQNNKPNILLIVADDLGYSDLGCYGSNIETPNLNKLANQGVRFSQFYNAARCCPSRASILTGLYPHQAGMGGMVDYPKGNPSGPYQGYLNNQCVTIAEVLQTAGYYTVAVGKWHVGEQRPHWPTDRGFDNYYGLISGASNYFKFSKHKNTHVKRYFAIDSVSYQPPENDFYLTDAITDHAVQYLKDAKTKNQPFFMYLAYTAPHWPLQAPQKIINKYRGQFIKGWDQLRKDRMKKIKELGILPANCELSPRDPVVPAWSSLTNKQKQQMDLLMAIYAAQIDCMDQGIGKILTTLDQLQLSENTIVIFLSDNGGCAEKGIWGTDFWGNFWDGKALPGSGDSFHSYGRSWANLSNTPFRMYKHWAEEGGISTPLIIRWPGVVKKEGTITSQTGHIIDLMATCCDAAGANYPKTYKGHSITPLQGESLKPILEGKSRSKENYYWEHFGNKAIREGKWKLVAEKDSTWHLYNLQNDRTELKDKILKKPQLSQKLINDYDQWAKKIGVRDNL